MKTYDIINAGPNNRFMANGRIVSNSGRLVQVQNLPRNSMDELDAARRYVLRHDRAALNFLYENVPDTLSQLIRTIFIPSPGHKLIVSDFSAIEARVIAWLAGEQWVLDVFNTHGKIYEATASQMFCVPLELIKKGNPEYELRQRGKVASLACGFGGSVNALERMDIQRKIDPSLYQGLVDQWRAANPNIVALWDKIGRAALSCVQTGITQRTMRITFEYVTTPNDQCYLTVTLPSGRKLYYVRPHLTTNRWNQPSLAYWGMDQTTKKRVVIETYGGKLVENIVQAIARDCLVVAMQRLETAGYNIVMHIHDEVVIDATPDQTLDGVNAIMGQPIAWADGLPLKAAGSEMMYYQKD